MRRWSERLMNVVSIQYELPLSSYYFFTDGCESENANCLKKRSSSIYLSMMLIVELMMMLSLSFKAKKITTHFDDVQ